MSQGQRSIISDGVECYNQSTNDVSAWVLNFANDVVFASYSGVETREGEWHSHPEFNVGISRAESVNDFLV